MAPGTMVSTPAAANTPQSMPDALTVRVITATMGLAFTLVSVRAISNSTQLNMKQKNAATPTPALMSGMKMVRKKRGERIAVDVGRLVDLARDAAHEAFEDPHRQRHVEQQVRQRHGDVRVHHTQRGVELEEGQQEHGGRRHAVGEQPEEHMLVTEEAVAA